MFAYKTFTKAVLLLAVSSLIGLCLISCDSCSTDPHHHNNDYYASEEINDTFDASGLQTLDLSGVSGQMIILGNKNATTIKMKAIKEVGSWSRRDAENYLDEIEVIVEEMDHTLYIYTVQPSNNDERNLNVFYEVEVPDDINIRLGQTNGDVEVFRMQNDVYINSTNGDILLDSLTHKTSVGLTNGRVRLFDTAGDLDVSVLNGSISGFHELVDNGQCRVKSLNGSISLTIPKNSNAMFLAKLLNGSIYIHNLDLQNQQVSQKEVSGRLGNGSGNFVVETMNGNISVSGI